MFSFGIIAVRVALLNVYVAYNNDNNLKRMRFIDRWNSDRKSNCNLYKPGVVGLDKIAVTITDDEGKFLFDSITSTIL